MQYIFSGNKFFYFGFRLENCTRQLQFQLLFMLILIVSSIILKGAYYLQPLKVRRSMQFVFCLKFIPCFNGAIWSKKLRKYLYFNILVRINIFLQKTVLNNFNLYQHRSFHCTINTDTKCNQVFQTFQQDAFSCIKDFPIEKWSLFLL